MTKYRTTPTLGGFKIWKQFIALKELKPMGLYSRGLRFRGLMLHSFIQSSWWVSAHKAVTRKRRCCLSYANITTCPQLHPFSFISCSTDRLPDLSLGLPLCLFASRVQRIAALVIATKGILQMCLIHLHLRCFTSRETFGW